MRYRYEENRYEIPVPEMKQGERYRLALLADLHNCGFEGVIGLLEAAKPDMVCCAGDMVNCPGFPRIPAWHEALSFYGELAKRFPVCAVTGNHEERWKASGNEALRRQYEDFCGQLSDMKIELLDNRTITCRAGGARLNISGLALGSREYHRGERGKKNLEDGALERRLGKKPEGFTVLLAHTPNAIEDYAAWGADLILSGHLHGGIVRLFGRGLIGSGFQLFPPYTRGKYSVGSATMLLSAGLGEHFLPLRVANPRQIIYAELKAPDT